MTELKPCPFCGGKAVLDVHRFWNDEESLFTDISYSVYCDSCKVSTQPWHKTKKEAIAAWNRRIEK